MRSSTAVLHWIVVVVGPALIIGGLAVTAHAEGPSPPPLSDQQVLDAQAVQETRAAEVGRVAALLVQTQAAMAQVQLAAESAADKYTQAAADAQIAVAYAEQTKVDAEAARVRAVLAQKNLETFARGSYIQGSSLDSSLVLMDSQGPSDMIERAGILDALSGNRLDVLSQSKAARVDQANADSLARQAVIDRQNAQDTAAHSLVEADDAVSRSKGALVALVQKKALYDQQLLDAQEALIGLQAAQLANQLRDDKRRADEAAAAATAATAARAAQQRSDAGPAVASTSTSSYRQDAPDGGESAVVSGAWALPLAGTLTSCYCERWGTMHWGVDIAAPMYTPIYAAGDGVVARSGEATGFGQVVYLQHTNGDVTVYGHMEVLEVRAGQHVRAGDEIAQVGSRGVSTGPHLHFEVTKGLYGPRVDPVAWLAARGVTL